MRQGIWRVAIFVLVKWCISSHLWPLATLWSNLTIVNTLNLLTDLCFIKLNGSFIHKCPHLNETAEGFLYYSCWLYFSWDVLLKTQFFPEYYGHCFSYSQEVIELPLLQVVDFKLTNPIDSQWNLLLKTLPWNTGKIFNCPSLHLLKLPNNNKKSTHYTLKNTVPALHHRSSKCSYDGVLEGALGSPILRNPPPPQE